MDYSLRKLDAFPGRPGPVVLVVLDGVGIGKQDKGDAFHLSNPKNLLQWMKESQEKGLYIKLKAHGTAVGLPDDSDMGNSEVGHNAIGSGRICNQGAKLVNECLQSGKAFESDTWKALVGKAAKNKNTVHFLGLLSDGNIHSHINQLFQLIEGAVKEGIRSIRIHALLDGRDVGAVSGLEYIEKLENKLASLQNEVKGLDAKIASGGGRMYVTMDRYNSNWGMVRRGWNAHVYGILDLKELKEISESYPGYFRSAKEAIETSRRVCPKPHNEDQFNPPFVIVDEKGTPVGKMKDGDLVINFNYRGDRAIQISQAFTQKDFSYFDRGQYPKVEYAGLLEYDTEAHIPPKSLVPPPDIQNVSAQYLCASKVPSYAVSETHKYGHVTYFWNGNKSGYINKEYEKYEEVLSDPNDLIESRPEMKAKEITEKLLLALRSQKYRFLRINYANGDMVGHTGNLQACIQAMKTVDELLPQVVNEVYKQKGIVIFCADHGNVEEKLDDKGKKKTSHTLNPIPFFILDSCYQGEYKIDAKDIPTPGIANITATFIELLGYQTPSKYEKSLISFQK
ncbi:MAG: phosphoglycerate mutase (2,3-diphosphoglycerate-independent) [Candidatus Brocadiae bacterium]|nr:phosphoglycerate mutase (2,3-diphosphoglycerate-independent) [Candidatus Brocadiia bacterium]